MLSFHQASFRPLPSGAAPTDPVLLLQLIETVDLSFCLDNEALYEILQKVCRRLWSPLRRLLTLPLQTLRKKDPTYTDLNALIANVMSGITTPFRFPGQLNSDLRKLGTNMVPFPRLHFLTVGYAPLTAPGATSESFQRHSVHDLVSSIFEPSNMMAATDPRDGKYLTVSAYFRGRNVSSRDVEDAMAAVQSKNNSFFVGESLCRRRYLPNAWLTVRRRMDPERRRHRPLFRAHRYCTCFGDVHRELDFGSGALQEDAWSILGCESSRWSFSFSQVALTLPSFRRCSGGESLVATTAPTPTDMSSCTPTGAPSCTPTPEREWMRCELSASLSCGLS